MDLFTMTILSAAITLFLILESLNILTLYFAPDSVRGNGLGVFNAWEKSKTDPDVHELVRYLVFWVAGAKLIFVALLLVILFSGNEAQQQLTVVAMIISIASFFWRLNPIMRKVDAQGQLNPSGYSKTLARMITGIIGFLAIALLWSLLR